MADERPPPPPRDTDATTVVCFTGSHARLPGLLASLRRRGFLVEGRCYARLADFARELATHEPDLVGIDCGPGNLRLGDALDVFRRARRTCPLVVISEPAAETAAAIVGLPQCRILSADDPPRLERFLREITGRTDSGASDRKSGTVAGRQAHHRETAALTDQQALLAALRPVLVANAARATLAVVRVSPRPDDGDEPALQQSLREALGGPALLARLDDTHYGALLERGDADTGVELAQGAREWLIEALGRRGAPAEQPLVAIGITPPRTSDGDRADRWLARAREACEVAARTDHGYAILSRTPIEAPTARDVPQLVQEALVSNQLVLQFQPIVSLRGDARQHYETLVRLPSATAGELLPADFFGHARARGLIPAIDHWVTRQAIRRLARERATNRRIHLFVPLGAETLADGRVLLAICDELRDNQAAGDWLTFQLRPADIRRHPEQTRRLVEGLRQIRCRLALERYDGQEPARDLLRSIPFDFAKLAPELVRDLHSDTARLERVRDAVGELERRGVRSVATGVEDSRSLAYLWTLGVDYAQGFFLHEPSEVITYDAAG